MVDFVSNPEVAASFGSDIVLGNCFDMNDPIIPGINSKDSSIDKPYRFLQIPLEKDIH